MIIFSRKFSKHFKMSVRIKPRFQHPNPRSYANAVEILENPVRSLVFVMPSDLTMTSQLPRVALSENAKYNKIAIQSLDQYSEAKVRIRYMQQLLIYPYGKPRNKFIYYINTHINVFIS